MGVIIVLIFFSLILVAAGLIFFFYRLSEGDFEHGDRLSLLPLAEDDGTGDNAPKAGRDKLDRCSFNKDEKKIETDPDSGIGPE